MPHSKLGESSHPLVITLTIFGCLLGTLLAAPLEATPKKRGVVHTAIYERLLIKGVEAIQRGDLDTAAELIEHLAKKKPDFRLAQVILGDIQMARAGRLNQFGEALASTKTPEYLNLLAEVRARITHLEDYP
ncbi:MAG: hypothetical protein HQL53_10955, partial [Magnetococcales bacterium]|nr:hypothetical protein [Magnetococcales bacterium]